MTDSRSAASFRCVPILILMGILAATPLPASEYFVSPQGSDDNAGTQQHPYATLQKAASVVGPGDRCYFREGTYRETLRPQRSGREGDEITFAAWQDEKVVLRGTEPITRWKAEAGGVYSAPMPWSLDDENQFFVDGVMLQEACWPAPGESPLFQPNRGVASGGSTTALVCDEIPGDDDAWKGARLWCAGGSAWICWTSTVTGYDADSHTLTFGPERDRWYTPRKGNLFVLRGLRRGLQSPGQWFYDAPRKRLLVIPPIGGDAAGSDADSLVVEAKRRRDAIDLSGRSHIRIRGIAFEAAGIRTNAESSHIVLENLHGRYVSHANTGDVSGKSGVLIHGQDVLLLSCDLGYSSGSVVSIKGRDHRVINCHVHHGGYGGLWRGTVGLSGRRIVFSHNTVRHAGRDLINTHGLMESLVQYNDVSDAGWLTKDLAMFYGHNTDFANTVFRYNLVHDNHAEHCAMGIYFDHCSHNAIVHHNVVFNMGMDPTRVNNPSYNCLVFNNTCANTGSVRTFDHSKRNDLFASRFFDNVYNQPISLPENAVVQGNHVVETPEFRDPAAGDYRLKEPLGRDIGAYAPGGKLWRAGCDLENPPRPLPTYAAPRIDWMNVLRNPCFEFGTLEGWQKTEAGHATLVEGNGWGNHFGGNEQIQPTGTSKHELRLGSGRDGVSQVVAGLSPGVTYTLSAWCKVSAADENVVLGVRQYGGPKREAACSSTAWKRHSIEFTTGPLATEATIYLLKTTSGGGNAWCDNLTLPLRPPTPKGK